MARPNIWELIALQRGAQLSPKTATSLGQSIGSQPLRGSLLATLVNQGKISVQSLSPEDTKAAGANLDKAGLPSDLGFVGKGIGAVGGFFGNLGSDAWKATKGFVPGLAEAGTSAVQDVTNLGLGLAGMSHGTPGALPSGGRHDAPESQIKKNVIDPQLDYYNAQYLTGNPLKNFYEHPLGPILDVATVASLGSGGAARLGSSLANAGKIAPESALARMGTTQGRSALSFNPSDLDASEVTTPSIARDYSARPLRKATQILTDKLGEKIPVVQRGQIWQARTFGQKMGAARNDSQILQQTHRQVEQLIPVLKDLSPHEQQAFDLISHGISSPRWVAEYESAVGRSIANDLPPGANAKDFGKIVDPKLAPTRANLPDEVKALAVDPAKSEPLMTALQSYYNTVDERVRGDMPDEVFDPKANELRDALTALRGDVEDVPQTNSINPDGSTEPVPGSTFEDLHRFDQRKFDKAEAEGVYVDDLRRDQRPPEELPAPLTPPPELQGVDPDPTGHPFPNPTIAPAQIAKDFEWHEPTRISSIFHDEPAGFRKKQGQFSPSNVTYQNVLQEPGNSLRPNPNPLLAGIHRPDMRSYVDLIAKQERDVLTSAYNAKLLDQWALKDPKTGEPLTVDSDFEAQSKYGKEYTAVHPTAPLHYYNDQTTVADMVSTLGDQGFPMDGPEMKAAVEAIGEDTVMKMTQAARKQKAFVIPRSVAEYQRKIENASKPYENPAIRGMARALNLWRTYTLSLMPRWALNTAVGSFILNTIKGVGPTDYRLAGKLAKGSPEHPNVFESKEMGGVQLGNQVGMEIAELGMQGGASGTNRVSRFAMEKVQGIEDYFRRASMVHSLSKEAAQGIRENGAIIAGYERSKGPRTSDEFRDFIQNDPKAVRKALDDVDRFAYNFAALGPFERRVVRQIAPFWGWYRFITGVVYRLPIDYPGRANVISSIGNIGMQHNEKFGEMPRWMMGNVLKAASGGAVNYFSTAGINPLGSFFNPGSPEGVSGLAQLGQASPIIQAGMAAYGIDPMSGGTLPVSPEHGYSPDFTGQLRNEKTGEEAEVGQVAPFQRALATLIRAFPEARIGERIHSGGKAPYPESIPLIAEYYRNTKPENRYGSGFMEALAQMTGTAVRPFNLKSYQSYRKKGQKYAIKKGARDRAKLKLKDK